MPKKPISFMRARVFSAYRKMRLQAELVSKIPGMKGKTWKVHHKVRRQMGKAYARPLQKDKLLGEGILWWKSKWQSRNVRLLKNEAEGIRGASFHKFAIESAKKDKEAARYLREARQRVKSLDYIKDKHINRTINARAKGIVFRRNRYGRIVPMRVKKK